MTATVSAGIPNTVALPDAAVLRDNENQPFVYIGTSPEQFGSVPVTLGESLRPDANYERAKNRRPGVGGSLFVQFANSCNVSCESF